MLDFTGHGESEGTPDDSTGDQQTHDLAAALDTLGKLDDIDARRVGVTGASSGAAVVVLAAARDARIRAVALRSPNLSGAEGALPGVRVPTPLVVGEHDETIRAALDALLGRSPVPRGSRSCPAAITSSRILRRGRAPRRRRSPGSRSTSAMARERRLFVGRLLSVITAGVIVLLAVTAVPSSARWHSGVYIGFGPFWLGPPYWPYAPYWYPPPSYVYPPPPVVVEEPRVYIQQPAPQASAPPPPTGPYWYYCESAGAYEWTREVEAARRTARAPLEPGWSLVWDHGPGGLYLLHRPPPRAP